MNAWSKCFYVAILSAASAGPSWILAQPDYSKMSLEEIRAGVTDGEKVVRIAYPEGGFNLATNVCETKDYKWAMGRKRNPFEKIFVVPAAIYKTARLTVSVDPDPKKDRVFAVRVTRYNDSNGCGRAFAGMMNVEVDFDRCQKRRIGDRWEVTVPLDMGDIVDLVTGEDAFGTWMNNTMRVGPYRVRPELGNYLDFEVLSRLQKFRSTTDDMRMSPDKKFTSAITVHAAELVKAGVGFEPSFAQPGNVFANDEKPETYVTVTPWRASDCKLVWKISDAAGVVVSSRSEKFREKRKLSIDLAQPSLGWYALDYELYLDGEKVLTHHASFALLGKDTRTTGTGEGPYGSWSYGGNHYCSRDIDFVGPLFEKIGFRRGEGLQHWSAADRHRYRLSPPAIRWDWRKMSEKDRIADLRRQTDEDPNVRMFMVFHEDAPWGYQQAWELTGQPVPNPTNYQCAGWHDPRGVSDSNRKRQFEKRAERHTRAMEQCAFVRRHFPQLKITLGNSLDCTELVAEAVRDGLPESYVDYLGIETVVRNALPEREGDFGVQACDLMAQLAERLGRTSWKPNASWETCYRLDSLIGADRQAMWYVRDMLIERAWRCPDSFVGVMTDCGNSYGGSFWGGSGLCRRAPYAYPKKSYVGVATLTKMLDNVVDVRRIPTGDACVYAVEYARRDGKFVTALWTSRGTAEVSLSVTGKAEYVDFYGRPIEPLRGGGLWSRKATRRHPVLKASEFAQYVVTDGQRVAEAKVGARAFPDNVQPVGAKLVKATDNAAEWKIESSTNAVLERMTGPFLPYRTRGEYAVREVVDKERGKCLEIELVKPDMTLPKLVSEYVVLELAKPVPLTGCPDTIGAWVMGNSGWGQFYWIVEDSVGRHYSCGVSSGADLFDYDGNVSVCYTGWAYLQLPITDASPIVNLSNDGAGNFWNRTIYGEDRRLVGIAFSAKNRPLSLVEHTPHPQKIRVGGIFASDYRK